MNFKCRDLNACVVQATTPSLINTDFNVPHTLGRIPRGAFIVGTPHSSARLYRAATLGGGLDLAALIGCWEFENSPPLALEGDAGPNALTLSNTAVTQTATAKVGTAANFVPASASKLTRNSEANLQTGDIDFTFACWVYAGSLAANIISIAKRDGVAANSEYQIGYLAGATNRFFGQVYRGAGPVTINASSFGLPVINTWYFMVVWHDATADTLNIQINNGVVDSIATGGALQAASTAQFRIGARQDAGSELNWNGNIDQVMFWKRVLTSGERTSLYNGGAGVSVADLTTLGMTTNFTGGWEFGDGAIGRDSHTNNLHTTCFGGAYTQPVGAVGNAVTLVSASSQYMARNSEALLQMGDIDFTLCAWAKFTGAVAANEIFGKDNNVAGQREYNLNYSTVSNVFMITAFRAGDTQIFGPATAFGAASVGVWYFVVGWHDAAANTLNIQVNNSAVTSTATGGSLQAASGAQFQIGARQYSTSRIFWNGDIDQAMIWKRILTEDERTYLYNGGAGRSYAQVAADAQLPVYVPWTATEVTLRSNVANVTLDIMVF